MGDYSKRHFSLTIAIPTYNRCKELAQTLNSIIPQFCSDIEIIVCNNASSDRTINLLEKYKNYLTVFNNIQNIGPDENFLSCINNAQGKYVWILSDDDLPAQTAIREVLKRINMEPSAGLLHLLAKGSEVKLENYSYENVTTDWHNCKKEEFILSAGRRLTFISSLVIKKDLFSPQVIYKYNKTRLTPLATALYISYKTDCISISDRPLVFSRGGNSQNFDALTTFTKNMHAVLGDIKKYGFSEKALQYLYYDTIEHTIPDVFKYHTLNLSLVFSLCKLIVSPRLYIKKTNVILIKISKVVFRRVIRRYLK